MKQYQDLPEVTFPHVRVERGTKYLYRSEFERVTIYAPGDGDLSFAAHDTRSHVAMGQYPTREECEAICPDGWEVYENGPYFRARKVNQLLANT